MKKLIILSISILLLLGTTAEAQCKFKKIKKFAKYAISEDCSVQVDLSTKPKPLFSKFNTTAMASFVKSGEEYFLFFYQVRGYSSKYEILENNSLVIIFEEGEPLSLYPCGNYSGKRPGISLTTYSIGCFYKINKDQIQKIADNIVKMVLIHVSTDGEIRGSQIDEDGTCFLEYIIRSDNYADNAPTAAACILSH